MSAPVQFTTNDGTLVGAFDGHNLSFSFNPIPSTLLFNISGVTGHLLFRNGLLVDEYDDYAAGLGYFAFFDSVASDTVTVELYQGGGPTKLRIPGTGLTAVGQRSLRLSPLNPTQVPDTAFMLFRNGQLLTRGPDYTVIGAWIVLETDQEIQPTDTFVAAIATGGFQCSTYDGSIGGSINGTNSTFELPDGTVSAMVFRNGQLLTYGQDYVIIPVVSGVIGPGGPAVPGEGLPGSTLPGYDSSVVSAALVLFGDEIPQPGDTLTAQAFSSGYPLQVTNYDGSLSCATAVDSFLFRNGLLMSQPLDGSVTSDIATLIPFQTPQVGDVITLEAWTPNIIDSEDPPFNLPRQFSSSDGLIIGEMNGVNNTFTVPITDLVTQIELFWNGDFLSYGVDYVWTCLQSSSAGPWQTQITMMAGQYPNAGDVLTAEVFLS